MSRPLSAALALVLCAATCAGAQAESYTTRIEPRPVYGATITVEQGVRVWRPLPPTRHMIVNPNNTPLNLSIADVRETVTHNHTGPIIAPPTQYAPSYGASPYYFYGTPHRYGYGHRGSRHRGGGAGGIR